MSLIDSFYVSIFGMSVVFAVLIALILLLKIQAFVFTSFTKKKSAAMKKSEIAEPVAISQRDVAFSSGELELVDVDEKTAAMIMAIISHESQIPLDELQFKSIKALDK